MKKLKKLRGKLSKNLIKDLIIILCALGLLGGGIILLWIASFDIPDLSVFTERKISQSTKIYDRTGEILLYDVHEDIKRTIIDPANISRHIKNATVAIEDSQFYEHNGIEPLAFVRAIFVNLREGEFSQGGSTLTQQVIKNTLLTTEKKVSRKLKEWVLAIKLENMLTKDEILGLYLNESPYGGSIYGIEEATRAFFDKSANDVTIAEAAYLAALPQAPTYYSPYGNNAEALEARKNLVLRRMLDGGFITNEEFEEAKEEFVQFMPRGELGILAPHFVFYVIEELEKEYGKSAIEERGFTVITSLDYNIQKYAEEEVKKFALQNKETFDAENAAAVVIDPKTGDILAMVGSRDYFDEEIDGNFNVALAHRQPGSAFKPFAYATALKKGYTPDTVVFDVQTEFSTYCKPDGSPINPNSDPDEVCYMPENYTHSFVGPVSLRDALAQSMNIPAIKVLYLAGTRDTLITARDLGIQSLSNVNSYGLTLVLGGGEVSPLDITGAYSVFANDGIRNEYRGILLIKDNEENTIFTARSNPYRVLDKEVARNISDMLSDNEARTPLFGANSLLYFSDKDVAVKTGTTNDYRDAWVVGYSPTVAVGVWVGNNDNHAMRSVSGLRASPLWRSVMDYALAQKNTEEFITPRGYDSDIKPILRGVWQNGGSAQGTSTPNGLDIHSILHWVTLNNPQGPIPSNPNDASSQYENWEWAVQKWAHERGFVSIEQNENSESNGDNAASIFESQ